MNEGRTLSEKGVYRVRREKGSLCHLREERGKTEVRERRLLRTVQTTWEEYSLQGPENHALLGMARPGGGWGGGEGRQTQLMS